MKYLISFILLILSFNANSALFVGYIGQNWVASNATDVWQFKCPAGTQSAVIRMITVDGQPYQYSEVNGWLTNNVGGFSSRNVYRYPYLGVNNQWTGLMAMATNANRVNYARIHKSILSNDPGFYGNFYYKLDVLCKTGQGGTGQSLAPLQISQPTDQ